MIGEVTDMYDYIHKYLKEYYKIILVAFIGSFLVNLFLYRKIGIKNSTMVFVALFFLIINIYLIFKDKRKSILLFLLLLPIYTTVRRVCYFDIAFFRVTFETIYVTILFICSLKNVINTIKSLFKLKEKLAFKFIFIVFTFLILCINSSLFASNILKSLSEVYIGLLTPIMLMLCFITYFNKEDKYKLYYTLILAMDFSCFYGFVQILSKGVSISAIKSNRIFLTFGFHNVNIFSGILISILPLLIEMILYKQNTKREKIYLYLSFLIFSAAILITFTRGAWLCYIGVIFISLFSKKYRKVFIILCIPALAIAKPVLHYIINRGTNTSFLNNESAVARLQSIFTDMVMMKNYPFGIGGGNFAQAYRKFSFQGYLSMPENIRFNAITAHYPLEHAHNLLLQIGVEFGLITAIIFILLIVNRLRKSLKDFKYNRGAFNSILIYFIFSVITGNEFNHKGVITGTLIIFIVFGISELCSKEKINSNIGEN